MTYKSIHVPAEKLDTFLAEFAAGGPLDGWELLFMIAEPQMLPTAGYLAIAKLR